MTMFSTIRLRAAAVLAGFALALSGCFMSPGKFTSELALTGPDTFTFSYEGEIFFLTLSKLAMMGATTEEAFTPSECYDEETYEARECTAEVLDAQRADWEAGAEERAAKAKKDAEMMKAVMGGIDPTDPKATEEMVRLLERQKGWNRVVHKGDGLFEVSYSVSGTLGHDFMFPTIEGFPATNPFVQMILRDGGQCAGFRVPERRQSDGRDDGRHGLARRACRYGRGRRGRGRRDSGRADPGRADARRHFHHPHRARHADPCQQHRRGPGSCARRRRTAALDDLAAHHPGPDRADRYRRLEHGFTPHAGKRKPRRPHGLAGFSVCAPRQGRRAAKAIS